MEKLVLIGTVLLFISILLIFIGSLFQTTKSGKTEIKSAGIVFIGPFPLGWASDKQTLYMLLAVVIVMIIFYLIFLSLK